MMRNLILPVLILIGVLVILLSLYRSQDLKRAYEKEILMALQSISSTDVNGKIKYTLFSQ
jgi:uncharacterized membrane protein YidH (DUF202 family)